MIIVLIIYLFLFYFLWTMVSDGFKLSEYNLENYTMQFYPNSGQWINPIFFHLWQFIEKNEGLLKRNKILKEQLECLERTGSDASVSENKLDNLTMKSTTWEELLRRLHWPALLLIVCK